MRRSVPAVLGRVLVVLAALAAPGARAASELKELQTEDLQLVWFTPHLDYLAPHVARSFENSMDWQKRVLGWQPDGKTNVLLKDFGDYGNAGARSNPNNALIVDVAPLSYAFETFVAAERMYALMNHELIHVAQMDQWAQGDMAWRRFFGGKVQIDSDHPETLLYHYLTTPRVVVPRWFMEGTAVFFETWMGGGIGRAQGAFDEMVFRSMVRDNAYFYDPTGLVAEGTKVDYQVGVNNYLYGTRFISFLALTYSPDHVRRWVARTDDSERYYDDQFEKVFGKPLETAWQDWIEWEKSFQAGNLAEVARQPITKHKPLSKQGLGSISRTYYDPDDRKLYAAFRYPGVAAFVGSMSIETGAIEPLIDIKGPMLYRVTSLAYDASSDTVFYTTDNNSGYRDIMALDVKSKEARMLFLDARIGDLAFNPVDRSLWGMRHLNGLVTLVRMPYPYTEYNQIHTFPYGEIAYDLDISPDGKLLSASVASIKGDQHLKVIEIEKVLAGDTKPLATFDFGTAVPESFVFAPDSKSLYGSSYYTGVSNIYRYDLKTQKIEALSNAETGYFRPMPLPDGRLMVFDYTAAGFPSHESTQFDLASGLTGSGFVPGFIDPKPLEDLSAVAFLGNEIAEKHPVVATWANGSPSRIDLAKRTVSEGDYSSTSQIGLQSFYPLVEGYKDTWAAGMRFNLSDPIGLDRMDFTFSYSPEDDTLTPGERTHFEANWRHRSLTVGFAYNDADFYDLFGPTKRSRKGNSWKVEWDKSLIFDKPKTMDLELSLRVHDNLDTLPYFQDILAPTDELITGRATLDYAYIINSLGNVDEEKGLRWDLNAVVNEHVADQVPALYGRLDMGVPFLFDHSSLWLRNSAGYAEGDVADPFANFFFGGFGNNWVDDGDEKRYRDHFSFPGFDISEVGGRSYARTMLEWNLPPIRFRSIGTPANYLSWARPAFFAGALLLNPDDATLRRKVADVGFQLDFQFYVMHAQEMTLSIGYALGFEDGLADREEFMLSLKVLH